MVIICNACGSANVRTNKACRTCGMPLSAPAEAGPSTDTDVNLVPASTGSATHSVLQPAESPDMDPVRLTTMSYTTRVAGDIPVDASAYFPYILFAGYTSPVYLQIKNQSAQAIEEIEMAVECRGLARPLEIKIERLPAGQLVCPPVEVEPLRAGSYVMQFTVKLRLAGQVKGLIAARTLKINAAPEDPNVTLEPQRLLLNGEYSDSPKADPRKSRPSLEQLFPAGKRLTLKALREFKLPENFVPIDLALDYQLSESVAEMARTQKTQQLIIPRIFLGYTAPGTVLKLTPTDPAKCVPLHLVARPQFKLGRSRMDADFITWFWPRTNLNDERTRHLSKLHVIGECQGSKLGFRDGGSTGGSAFDGTPLSTTTLEPVNRRAALALSAEYLLDVHPMPSSYEGEPAIRNIKLWAGPNQSGSLMRGAVRFTPLNTQVALHNAVWLFTDANFGTSRSNTVILDIPELSEIQGSFHHYRGCFWIENRVSNDAVRINLSVLNANEIAPLMSGQILQLGSISFQVEVAS